MTDGFNFDFADKIIDADGLENGKWFQLNNPLDGSPLFLDPPKPDGKGGQTAGEYPVMVKVRSSRSEIFRQAEIRAQAQAMTKARKSKGTVNETEMREATDGVRSRQFGALMVQVKSFDSRQPGAVHTPDDKFKAAMASEARWQWLVEFVYSTGTKDENFGIDEGNAPAPAADGGDNAGASAS